jgi:hypothetical protein
MREFLEGRLADEARAAGKTGSKDSDGTTLFDVDQWKFVEQKVSLLPIGSERLHAKVIQSPQQTNTFDCGTFALANMVFRITGRHSDLTQKNMPEVRNQLAIQLVAGTLDPLACIERVMTPLTAPVVDNSAKKSSGPKHIAKKKKVVQFADKDEVKDMTPKSK